MAERIELRIRVSDSDDRSAATSVAERAVGLDYEPVPGDADEIARGDAERAVASVVAIRARANASAQFVKEWWAERDGGLVIDQRPGAAVDIYRDADEQYGHVIVFPVDGGSVKVSVEEAPKDAVERWISDVISRAHRTVGDLTKLVVDKPAGDKIDIVVEQG